MTPTSQSQLTSTNDRPDACLTNVNLPQCTRSTKMCDTISSRRTLSASRPSGVRALGAPFHLGTLGGATCTARCPLPLLDESPVVRTLCLHRRQGNIQTSERVDSVSRARRGGDRGSRHSGGVASPSRQWQGQYRRPLFTLHRAIGIDLLRNA